ncbi:MAG: PIN domain-containing protein [Pseudomonadota bacterium]
MSDKVFVDTNVLVYFRDPLDAEKQGQAAAWMEFLWRTRTGRLSFQVLQEYYVTVTEKISPGLDPHAAREDVRSLLSWTPVPVDARCLDRAWAIQERYRITWWESLIVSAAHLAGCRYLVSEDLQHQALLGEVRIINPFMETPRSLNLDSAEGAPDNRH